MPSHAYRKDAALLLATQHILNTFKREISAFGCRWNLALALIEGGRKKKISITIYGFSGQLNDSYFWISYYCKDLRSYWIPHS